MSRFLCFTLLFLLVFPLFAQDEPMVPEPRPMPRGNQAMLLRMRQQLTQELQQLQRMISAINPNDTQFLNLLKAQQTELTKQMKDITQQLDGFNVPGEDPATTPAALPDTPKPPQPAVSAVREQELSGASPLSQPGGMSTGMLTGMPLMPMNQPYAGTPPYPIDLGMGMSHNPAWSADQTLDSNPWAPKPSKELLEIKQTVESLRVEVAELKATIKALETQIQLLNRNILLSEKAKE